MGSGHKGCWIISEPFLGCCTCFIALEAHESIRMHMDAPPAEPLFWLGRYTLESVHNTECFNHEGFDLTPALQRPDCSTGAGATTSDLCFLRQQTSQEALRRKATGSAPRPRPPSQESKNDQRSTALKNPGRASDFFARAPAAQGGQPGTSPPLPAPGLLVWRARDASACER